MMVKKTKTITAKALQLIVYDFDGVMTNNKVIVFQDGTEAVVANRADGWGVGLIRSWGIRQLILSTETNPIVQARANKLSLEVIACSKDKKTDLMGFCAKNGFDLEKVLYIGNDSNDLEVMKIVGYPVAPADAHPDIIKISCLVTKAKGGEGVVRELADLIKGKKSK
jgi:3-deoxy-D-manno-octulosonate 8-phosphate phosphatase (KDO 8-P phosphatase)